MGLEVTGRKSRSFAVPRMTACGWGLWMKLRREIPRLRSGLGAWGWCPLIDIRGSDGSLWARIGTLSSGLGGKRREIPRLAWRLGMTNVRRIARSWIVPLLHLQLPARMNRGDH